MTKHRELLLGGKKTGETSFLSQHCEDGVFQWGWQDGKQMSDSMKKYMVKPKPLMGSIDWGKAVQGEKQRKKRLAHA